MLNKANLRSSISAAVIASGLALAAGIGAAVVVSMPAMAQATLSGAQIAAIQSSLASALAAARSDEEKAQAISSAIQSAIAVYGDENAAAITSVVMSKAEANGVPASVIGRALAQASASLAARKKLAVADAIASTVANEGNAGERNSYQSAAISLGYANLASIAGQGPTVTGGITGGVGGIGAGGAGGGFTGGGAAGGGGGGCLNPSCTSL